MEKETSKPDFSRTIGSLRLACWENKTVEGGGVWWNVSIVRRWKSKTGEWQESSTLNGLGDIALARSALKLAERYIVARQDELDKEEFTFVEG